MEQTKYDCGNLRVVMEDALVASLTDRGVMVDEVKRLVESFGNKLLMTKAAGEIDFTNKTSGASMKLDMQWESDISAVVYVKEVNMEGKKREVAVN
ncbi:hypothetical protein FO488_01790 [Geobacter sp. FeAm09]|uniref:hypothetical protein n=1 Tax=Geobacter sp. FeAm09 TaxID=2597769 RepID=UPI0011ED57E1|nr:hypothetical protein [Geobacter sp. FeAm09]QEM67012.1 hypothetical protein FO488_01790 [Geobacter sp. FeAm09]